jgi:hypothetical protein
MKANSIQMILLNGCAWLLLLLRPSLLPADVHTGPRNMLRKCLGVDSLGWDSRRCQSLGAWNSIAEGTLSSSWCGELLQISAAGSSHAVHGILKFLHSINHKSYKICPKHLL